MKNFITILTIFLLSVSLYGKTKITSVAFQKVDDNRGQLTVNFQEPLTKIPELTVKNKILQVLVPDSFVWPMIEKKVTVNKKHDTKIMAYQYTKNLVRVRAVFPYDINDIKSKVELVEKEKSMEVFFPIGGQKEVSSVSSTSAKNANIYDEAYLENLLNDREISKMENPKPDSDILKEKSVQVQEDKVSLKMTGQEKNPGFSLPWYIGKFIVFLGAIILGFIGLVFLLKKSVFAKSRLGLLHNSNIIEVLNKTYISPKKSILAIKAYEQIILVGLDEKGMHFLTEIKNPTGLLKAGEKELAGDNFDTNVTDAAKSDKEFNLKEILDKPAGHGQKESGIHPAVKVNKGKFSEKIKSKMRDLKSLQ